MKKFNKLIIFLLILNSADAKMVFLEPPENFKPELEVATCYVMNKGKALFLKRCTTSTWSHMWGLPGGKVEEDQTPLEAMLREVYEETKIDLLQQEICFLGKAYVRDPKKDFVYYMFKCEISAENNEVLLAEDEHVEYRWLEPKEALAALPLVPGEDECINLIFQDEGALNSN
jgi:8-oxo-dGTP diphosphatase